MDALTASLVCLLNRLLGASLDLIVRSGTSDSISTTNSRASVSSSSASKFREELAAKYGTAIDKYLQPDSLAALLAVLFDSVRY